MALAPKFRAGDVVKTTRSYPNDMHFSKGHRLTVKAVDTSDGRYIRYNFVGERDWVKVTERNLELVTNAPAPKPKPDWKGAEHLAKAVVDTAKHYAEVNDWCDVVNEALREMGLEDFVTEEVSLRAVFTLDVTGDIENAVDVARKAAHKALAEAGFKVETHDIQEY